jgi:hypothetical protein
VTDGAKTTVEVDAALMARLREASMPASASLTDAELLERAGLPAARPGSAPRGAGDEHADGEEAMRTAYDELHAARREQRHDSHR